MAPIINMPRDTSHFVPLRIVSRVVEIKHNINPINTYGPIEKAPRMIRGKNVPVINQAICIHFVDACLKLRQVAKVTITPRSAQSRSTKPGSGQTGSPVILA